MNACFSNSDLAPLLFGVAAMVVMTVAILILVTACALGQRWWYILCTALLTAAVLCLLQGITDLSNCVCAGNLGSCFSALTGAMPVAAVVGILVLMAVAEVALLRDLTYKRKNTLTPNAIKESLDALPDGICFFTDDGQPVLVNTRMQEISWALFGTELLNGERFWSGLKDEETRKKAEVIRTGPTVIARIGAETVWDFRRSRIRVGRTEVNELVAFNVTDQYRLTRELEQRNRRLAGVNERLRRYSQEIEKVTAEKEILNAKIRVHDDVGRALLAFRAYLSQPWESRDRESLLLLWRYTIGVLKKETAPLERRDDWELLRTAAQAVDVAIDLEGELPERGKARAVVIAALHECLTNTVKHAGGNRLCLAIRRDGDGFTVELTNNGIQPRGEIRETGGLKNLRHTVESVGGTMKVETEPRFALVLTLPEGEERI